MNDFTKDELQFLCNAVCTGDECPPHDLLDKIQSLIENYCDHTWTGGSGNMIFCAKCQAYGGRR